MNVLIVGDEGQIKTVGEILKPHHTFVSFGNSKSEAAMKRLEQEAGVSIDAVIVVSNDAEGLNRFVSSAGDKLKGTQVKVIAVSNNDKALKGLGTTGRVAGKFTPHQGKEILAELKKLSEVDGQTLAA